MKILGKHKEKAEAHYEIHNYPLLTFFANLCVVVAYSPRTASGCCLHSQMTQQRQRYPGSPV